MILNRKFPACGRTIIYNGRPRFVRFPSLIFRFIPERFTGAGIPYLFVTDTENRIPLMPNINTKGKVCLNVQAIRFMAAVLNREEPSSENDLQAFNMTIEKFWASSFTDAILLARPNTELDRLREFEANLENQTVVFLPKDNGFFL